MGLFKNLLDVTLVCMGPAGWLIGSQIDEEINNNRRKGREEGFKDGVNKGVAEANKKFAKMQNQNR